MLQFIVLGLIPGTHIQITFDWVLLAVSLLLLVAVVKLELPRITNYLQHQQKPTTE